MKVKSAYRKAIGVWMALIVLLAVTCASAFVPMGTWNDVTNFAIAALKAFLVAAFFMHLASAQAVYRTVVLAALFGLSLLLGLSLADYTTRAIHTAPYQVPEGATSTVR